MNPIARALGWEARPAFLPDPATCPHAVLTPRWRNNTVRGDLTRAMGFLCHRCQHDFLPDEAHILLTRRGATGVTSAAPTGAAPE